MASVKACKFVKHDLSLPVKANNSFTGDPCELKQNTHNAIAELLTACIARRIGNELEDKTIVRISTHAMLS